MNLNPVSAAIETGAKAVETVAGVFSVNPEKQSKRQADEQMALLKSYQAEFNQRTNRSAIDAFADAFNRLIRPILVTIIISVFVIAYFSPTHFTQISLAMASIPPGYWALLSVMVGFYFGGRMQLKSHDFQLKQAQVDAVKALIETKTEFRKLEMNTDEPDRTVGDSIGKDEQVELQRQEQRNGVIAAYQTAVQRGTQEQTLAKTVQRIKEAPEDEPDPFAFEEEVD